MNTATKVKCAVLPLTHTQAIQLPEGTIFRCQVKNSSFVSYLMRTDSLLPTKKFINLATGRLCKGGIYMDYNPVTEMQLTKEN